MVWVGIGLYFRMRGLHGRAHPYADLVTDAGYAQRS
jgi:hypothetical protein